MQKGNRTDQRLASLGVSKGDRVALIAESRPEWLIADIAIMAAGGISVPAYTTNQVGDHVHILRDSGAKAAMYPDRRWQRTFCPRRRIGLEFVITMEPLPDPPDGMRLHIWDELISTGGDGVPDVGSITRSDTSCLIYTSGTGGVPKGVMLSHGAIISNCKGAYHLLLKLGLDDEKFLSFLPLSHSYEHGRADVSAVDHGANLLCGKRRQTRRQYGRGKPDDYDGGPAFVRNDAWPHREGCSAKGRLIGKAVYEGRRNRTQKIRRPTAGPRRRVARPLLTKLVRKKVAGRFGGQLKAMVSGGAPLNYDIGTFFKSLDVPLLQGYGQTESAPIISCNLPTKNKIHTVGPHFVDVDLKIADDGEILVKGELVMQGYWNMPEATSEAITNGWLHTGDIGKIDQTGFL